eukprot:tig00021017_g17189.t1
METAQVMAEFIGRPFAFGKVTADLVVLHFRPDGFPEERIESDIVQGAPHPPGDVQSLPGHEEHHSYWNNKLSSGEIFNDVRMLALKHWEVAEGPRGPALRLELAFNDYVSHRTLSSVFAALPDHRREEHLSSERIAHYVDGDGLPQSRLQPCPLFSSSFGVNVVVITADGKAVLGRRSERVAVYPGGMVAGVAEGLDESDVGAGGGAADVYGAVTRGLHEELGPPLPDGGAGPRSDEELRAACDVSLTALCVTTDLYDFSLLGYARFREGSGWTAAKLRGFRTQSDNGAGPVVDAWEFDRMGFVEFTPEAVARLWRQRGETLVPTSRAGLVLALLSCYEPARVFHAFSAPGPEP